MAVYEMVAAKGGPKMGFGSHHGAVADWVSRLVERPVLDKTGLTVKYNIEAAFNPPGFLRNRSDMELEAPDLSAVLQEQLRMRLQPANAMAAMTVVDQIERMPSEN